MNPRKRSGITASIVGRRLDNPGAQNQRFDLRFLEHQRRQVEPGPEHIANASLAFDRHAAGHQILDIAVDGAFRYFQRLAQVTGPDRRLAAEQLDDFEQTIGAAHGGHPGS
jgi:hypothetical protein